MDGVTCFHTRQSNFPISCIFENGVIDSCKSQEGHLPRTMHMVILSCLLEEIA